MTTSKKDTALVTIAPPAEHHRREDGDGAPLDFDGLVKMGEALVRSGMLPNHVRTGGAAAAIIMTGRELGMRPMRALRSLMMVQGMVVEKADSQLSRFKADGGRAQFTELDEVHAVLVLRHPNGDEHTETWTIEDAERAGLTKPDRNGGPSMHKKFPKAMNRSRCITSALKSLGWEGGIGIYDPDELPVVEARPTERLTAKVTTFDGVVDDDPLPDEPGHPTQVKARAEMDQHLRDVRARIADELARLAIPKDRMGAEVERVLGRKPQNLADYEVVLDALANTDPPDPSPSAADEPAPQAGGKPVQGNLVDPPPVEPGDR